MLAAQGAVQVVERLQMTLPLCVCCKPKMSASYTIFMAVS